MKIVLIYQEPETQLNCYRWREVFDEKEVEEAVELLNSVREMGYDVKAFKLVHDKDVWKLQ